MSIGNILIAVILFSAIILFHELGHFLFAKANKIAVIEFSLGMGPRIISFAKTDKGCKVKFFASNKYFEDHEEFDDHTIYSWKILPFGGSCMMLGEMEDIQDDRAFGKKSVWARMSVIFGGPFFNFILAFVLSLFVIGIAGHDQATITEIEDNTPMAGSSLQVGDVITSINGQSIYIDRELGSYIQFNPFEENQSVELVVNRNGQEIKETLVPALVKDKKGNESYKLGFLHGERLKTGFFETIKYSAYEVKFWIETTIKSLGMMIRGRVSAKEVSGPVGIVKVVGDVVEQSAPGGKILVLLNVLNMGILLTANLGVMNLLPIPALDGGRLLFLIIEAIRRKPIPEKVDNYITLGGFILLMALMVLILFNDIWKLI